jgi:hypothetical protein
MKRKEKEMPIGFVVFVLSFFFLMMIPPEWMAAVSLFSFLSIKVKELDIAAGHHVSFLYTISRR